MSHEATEVEEERCSWAWIGSIVIVTDERNGDVRREKVRIERQDFMMKKRFQVKQLKPRYITQNEFKRKGLIPSREGGQQKIDCLS